MLWIGLLIGLIFGCNLGVICMALFKINRR